MSNRVPRRTPAPLPWRAGRALLVGSFLLGTLLAIAPGAAAQTDKDGDGLSDDDELIVYGTDLLNLDTDGDGLYDGDELIIYGTDPLNPDTDRDGSSDGAEVYYGTNPLVPGDFTPSGGGDNANQCVPAIQFGNTGDLQTSGDETTGAPSNAVSCDQEVQQSSAASS